MPTFFVESLYGYTTRQGLVQVTITDDESQTVAIQMDVTEAMNAVENILNASVAAQSDEMLCRFFTDKMGVDDVKRVAALLGEFRQYRAMMESRTS